MTSNHPPILDNTNNSTYTFINNPEVNYSNHHSIQAVVQPGQQQQSNTMTTEFYNINDEIFFNNNYQCSNEQFNEYLMNNISSSASSLQNMNYINQTSRTTPEVSNSPKQQFEKLVPHQQEFMFQQSQPQYYYHDVRHNSTSSLPIDQLNLLSLKSLSSSQNSKSPSPEYYNNLYRGENIEERTINPRELLNTSKIPVSLSSPSLSTLFKHENKVNYKYYNSDKITENKQKQQQIQQTHQSQITPKFDFKMNDECFNAISYWLNNTLQTVDDEEEIDSSAAEIMTNPTGIIKSNFYYKRRNSIQLSNPSSYNIIREDMNPPPSLPSSQIPNTISNQKKKRRKSYNNCEQVLLNSSTDLKSAFKPAKNKSIMTKVKLESSNEFVPSVIQAIKSRSKQPSPVRSTKSSPLTTPKINQKEKFIEEDQLENGEMPAFPCPNCDKQFKRSEHLKRHHRSVHSNIRPFHCKYCDKKFSRSDNLAQHLKTHYKVDSNGTTTIIYGNPNVHHRKKKD